MVKFKRNIIREGVLLRDLPDDIVSTLANNRTSIGNNPAIPDIYDTPFLLKLANKRFDDVKNVLKDMGSIDDFDENDIDAMLSKLINKCHKIEMQFKDELEKICINYVIDLFNIPDETVKLSIDLVDSVDMAKTSTQIDPVYNDDFEYDTVDDAKEMMGEVYKRRLLLAMCMGESIILSSDIKSYQEKIEKLSPELCDLYYKIIALNNYSLYTKDNIGIDDKNVHQLGTCELKLGQLDDMPEISSQGVIFPVLLCETIRGLLELFISHGLPSELEKANSVIRQSDFLKSEPWDMRLGPSLWTLFSKSFNDLTLNELPYLLKRISELDVDKFNFLMKEVFAGTKKGKSIMSKICGKSKNDIEYDKFTDKMSKKSTDKSVITDEYIGINEL